MFASQQQGENAEAAISRAKAVKREGMLLLGPVRFSSGREVS